MHVDTLAISLYSLVINQSKQHIMKTKGSFWQTLSIFILLLQSFLAKSAGNDGELLGSFVKSEHDSWGKRIRENIKNRVAVFVWEAEQLFWIRSRGSVQRNHSRKKYVREALRRLLMICGNPKCSKCGLIRSEQIVLNFFFQIKLKTFPWLQVRKDFINKDWKAFTVGKRKFN